jgi:hypothetical protein
MLIPILFVFVTLATVRAFNVSDCVRHGEPQWFCDYMQTHGRQYKTHGEAKARLQRVQQSMRLRSRSGVLFGPTSRSDRFKNELQRNHALLHETHLSLTRSAPEKHVHLGAPRHLPPIDWRTHNGRSYVSPVKDQGVCGGCFAFASATVLEYWSKVDGFPKSLSPQALMDCTSGSGRPDDFCDGGLMEYVFEYAKRHPVPLDVDVPYQEDADVCPQQLTSHVRVNNYRVLVREETPKAESEIEWLLHAYGPVTVGVDSTTMDHYKGGVFKGSMCTTDIDHAVTIIGYTEDAWIIKNSWGPDWGVDGYLYLEKGTNACGVAEYIVYVTDAQPALEQMSTTWQY